MKYMDEFRNPVLARRLVAGLTPLKGTQLM